MTRDGRGPNDDGGAAATAATFDWCFDPTPPSGARQGGDPAQFVFEPDVRALVRETLQNANDQLHRGQAARVDVAFRVERFTGERLAAVRSRFRLDVLRAHLASLDVARARFEAGLEMLDGDALTGLWIEDRGTTGLVGDEDGSGNFAALCRDRLFSEKQRAESGGSFGLGKAVLWRFSHLSTVALYSRIAVGPDAGRERFIIKAALPYHHPKGEPPCAGDGWFGRIERARSGGHDRAVSLWDGDARAAAESLGARLFGDDETGTSILVLGFGDPADEGDGDGGDLEPRLAAEARRSFWPALSRGRLHVSVGGEPVWTADGAEARLAAMLRRYENRVEVPTLDGTDEIAVERVAVHLPARKDGKHDAVDAVADVIVQLVDEKDDDRNALWMFRGPGMIIERRELRQLSLSARPYRAVLVCGEALRDAHPQAAALEKFLQTAEPPAHDRWTPTPRLRETYRRGWKVALDRLKTDVEEAIRKHIVAARETDDRGPDRLRRLFRTGVTGGGRSESEFHFRQLDAHLEAGAWHFRAQVRRNTKTEAPWTTVVDLEFPEERGRARAGGTLMQADVDVGTCAVIAGRAHISAPADVDAVWIRGRTDPNRHPIASSEAAIELVLRTRAGVTG